GHAEQRTCPALTLRAQSPARRAEPKARQSGVAEGDASAQKTVGNMHGDAGPVGPGRGCHDLKISATATRARKCTRNRRAYERGTGVERPAKPATNCTSSKGST